MTDSMNFGPEWLRTLSQAPVQVPQQPRYQLAEFRYGREEMLALFSTTLVPPESLKQITGLFVKEAQLPLALSTMSDEETRSWNRGINSEAVIRSGKGGGGGRGRGRGTGGPGPGSGGGGIGYYGRGGSSGPPGSDLTVRPTGPGGGLSGPIGPYDESDIGFARPNRPFDRSQSERGRDSWSERNGGEGRGGGGRHTSENWRRGGRGPVSGSGGGEEDEWRPAAKWSMSSDRPYSNRGRANSGNWRDEDNWDPMPHSKSNNHHLPEWATEKNSEGGGTFDASGAFRSSDANIDDDERQSNMRTRKSSTSKSPHEPGPELRKSQEADENSGTRGSGGDAPSWSSGGGSGTDDRGEGDRPMAASEPPEPDIKEPTAPPQSKERVKPGSSMDLTNSASQQPPNQSEPPHGEHPPSIPMQKSVQHKAPAHGQPPQPSAKHMSPPPPPPHLADALSDDPLGHMTDDIAAEFVAKLMEEEENKDKQWYYRDPQGQVQGPFSCAEMAEWFQLGYFNVNLLVRRACDPNYAPLGDLIKLWGCIPFMPEPQPLTEEVANATRQAQDNLVMAQYQQHYRNFMLSQQTVPARAQMTVPPPTKMPHEWMERGPATMMDQVLPPQYQPQQPPPQMSHLASNNSLRALLAQMQQQQQQQQQQQHQKLQQQARTPYPRTTEEISQKVSDFLRLLQAKSENGVMRPPQLSSPAAAAAAAAGIVQPPPGQLPQQSPAGASSPGVMETLLSLHQHQQMAAAQANMPAPPSPVPANPSPVHNFLRQMQSESVWNGGNWNQWSHVSTKGIKTEQEVLEEQLRAEDERKSDEAREQADKFVTATSKSKKSDKTKLKEQQQQQQMVEKTMREMRETEEMRRQEEEELRRKQEASRRAEVERQRKGEEKRKKEEERRKKEEEKKERDRLKEEERKKREAEEAKKKAADLMAKVQRSQWCPPAASDTSILDIQRSEREQQMLRGMQQQMDAAEQQQQQKIGNKMQLNWNRQMVQHDVSLAEIQAEERQRKEKQEREKEKSAQQQQQQQQQTGQMGGSMSGWWQSNPWSSSPAWSSSVNPLTSGSTSQQQSSSSTSNNFTSGFWEQLTSNSSSLTKGQNGAQANNSGAKPSSTQSAPGSKQQPQYNSGNVFHNSQQQQQQQQQQPQPQQQQPQQNNQQQSNKEAKSKTKRDEMAVLKLFSTSTNDEFSQWCTEALSNIQSSVDIPTFIGFLRDLESAQDVQDYIRLYLGETKEASDFARQFLERRRHSSGGGGLSSASGGGGANSSSGGGLTGSSPTSLSNSQDFQQVKAKNKKKKGRMQKVDSRILNFSTTSASGRINVGDRQYPEE